MRKVISSLISDFMRAQCLLYLASAARLLTLVQALQHDQIPLQPSGDGAFVTHSLHASMRLSEASELDWDRAPPADSTGHLIFATVNSLLQRWPNTVIRPGKRVVCHCISECRQVM